MNMTITCALRWRVATVGIFSTGHDSLFMGKIFQVQGKHRWTTLIGGCSSTESRHMTFIILFVKSVEQTSLTCIFGVKELYLKLCELF